MSNRHHTKFLDLTNGEGGDFVHDPGDDDDYPEVDDEEDMEDDEEEGDDDDDGMGVDTDEPRARMSNADPSTVGRVVETGREHTGRWTKEEHEAFLSALQLYGKEWKKVAAKVKTRTVVQTRTHAQKYFQKLQKTIKETGIDDIPHVEMGISSTSKKRREKKARGQPSIAPATKQNRRSSSATLSAAQVISNLNNPASGSHSSYIATGSSVSMSAPPRHGFSMAVGDGGASAFPAPFSSSSWLTSSGLGPSAMKISIPDPSMQRGFPEPSPAATGKRKLAEIAAARMLAGVAGTAAPDDNDDEGPPTPPPSVTSYQDTRLNLKDAPMPPLFGDANGPGPVRKGLTLQIVNPESLGVTYDTATRKRGGGESPVTPWDGQLQALRSEVSKKAISPPASDEPSNSGLTSLPPLPFTEGMAVSMPTITGPSDSSKRTPLHKAVAKMDLVTVHALLEEVANRSEGVLQRLDEAGHAPIHSACAAKLVYPEAESVAMVSALLVAGADPSQTDRKGNTPLHWAARAGDKDVAVKLLLRNSPLNAKNHTGETPLHWALRSGNRGIEVATVLLENGARPGILSKEFRRPIDVAAEGYLDEHFSLADLMFRDEQGQNVKKDLKRVLKETVRERKDARANLLIRSAHSRTLVLHHPECLEHHPKSEHDWEAPDRIRSIMRRVLPSSDSTGVTETSGVFPHEITVSQEFDRAKLDLLSRVHSTDYLSFVNELSKDLERQVKEAGGAPSDHATFSPPPTVVPFTPLVQRTMIKIDDASVKSGLNSDTSFSAGSLKAARRAAGAVQHAVDCVLVGRNRNAFCVVRPPGHHAGINGLLEGGESCGFCIFNNVAAGALYAISDDRLLCNRCAIVDIDVHHGNGTEEIVRKCHDPTKLFFFSIHLFDNDKRKKTGVQYPYKFYPGTGNEDDLALNIINVPIVPLWKDQPPTASTSTSRTMHTRQKTRSSQDSQDESSETGTPRDDGAGGSTKGGGGGNASGSESGSWSAPSPTRNHVPSSAAASGRLAYRQAIQSRLLPALRAFNPDLILISAGFDAAKGDVGNARHERGRERMGLDLQPEDYAWTTRKILEIADICCQGRVVSVLEGGYGRTPVMGTGLDRTLFAECAIRHLQAMIDPYDSEKRFSS